MLCGAGILNTSGTLYEFGRCNSSSPGSTGQIPRASGNTFFVPGTHSALNASPYYSFEDDRSKYLLNQRSKGSFLVGAGGAAPGNASFQCGSQELSLAEAQRAGYELR